MTNGPATLTLAGRYPSTAHAPMATETRAAHRVLSSGMAEASCSGTTSWLIAAPLRSSSGVLGVMVAASSNRKSLREEHAEVVQAIGRQLAQAIERDTRGEEQRLNDRSSAAIRRLLENGSGASTVREAGTILAQVAADAFQCERARHVRRRQEWGYLLHGGCRAPPDICDALAAALVGKRANESPAWQRTAQSLGPALVGDSKLLPVRPGGLVRPLGSGRTSPSRSYLLKATSATSCAAMSLSRVPGHITTKLSPAS